MILNFFNSFRYILKRLGKESFLNKVNINVYYTFKSFELYDRIIYLDKRYKFLQEV